MGVGEEIGGLVGWGVGEAEGADVEIILIARSWDKLPMFKEILLRNMDIAIKSGCIGWGMQQIVYQKSFIEYKIEKNKQ